MISRHWSGTVRPEHVADYVRHLREETFPSLTDIDGFVDATLMKRNVGSGVEFLVVTRWSSMEAIGRFAGEDPTRAVVPDKVRRWMLDFDRSVRHYEVL